MRVDLKSVRNNYVNLLRGELDLLSEHPERRRFPVIKLTATMLFNMLVVFPLSVLVSALAAALILFIGVAGTILGMFMRLFKDMLFNLDFLLVSAWFWWEGMKIVTMRTK